jgi:glycosyltransferase involved in cell wall biosynthesis
MTQAQRHQALVTIGVPVYNGDRHISSCLDSLLAQTHREFVLLVADNASTDRTAEICMQYAAKDSRVKYHRHPSNIGMYGNFNFLLRSVQTPYLKLANADDFWAPEMVADALEVMERDRSVELCYPMMTLVAEDGSETELYPRRLHVMDRDPVVRFRRVLAEIGLVSQLMGVVRTSTVQRMQRLTNHPVSDRMFVAEIALYGAIFQTGEFQYFRRFHPGSSSFDRSSEQHQLERVFEQGVKRLRYMAWKYHLGLLRRVARSPLQVKDKLRLALFLGRNMVWDRDALISDLVEGLQTLR